MKTIEQLAEHVMTGMYEDPQVSEAAHAMALELWGGSQNEYDMLMTAESERNLNPTEARLYDLYWMSLTQAHMMILTATLRLEMPFLRGFMKKSGE